MNDIYIGDRQLDPDEDQEELEDCMPDLSHMNDPGEPNDYCEE